MVNFHLLVLVHGLWGNKAHFDYIIQEIEKKIEHWDSSEKLIVYRCHGNEGYKTLDGIDVCGLRVASEIREQIDTLGNEGHVTKFSIVGYSLGGLISRYAVGILNHQNVFKDIEPLNFTTFCTPHVGVLTPGSNISVKIFNSLVPSLLSLSGKQMFLKDNSDASEGPLLSLMANPSSVFYKGLSRFKYRNLYANAINDKRTAWWTSGISMVDPFIKIDENSNLDELDFKYIDTYDPIVIDADAKFVVSNRPISSTSQTESDAIINTAANFWERKLKWVKVLVNILILAPIWVIRFIISNALETFKSQRRIKSTYNENSDTFSSLTSLISNEFELQSDKEDVVDDDDVIDVTDALSRTSSIRSTFESFVDQNFEQSLQDKTDDFMESIWGAMTSKDEAESAKIAQYDFTAVDSNDKESISDAKTLVSINDLAYFPQSSSYSEDELIKLFTLDLSEAQLEIIKSLNNLKWEKYPILIRYTTSTHSAAIVRNIDDLSLFEGKTVVKHWLDNVFRLN